MKRNGKLEAEGKIEDTPGDFRSTLDISSVDGEKLMIASSEIASGTKGWEGAYLSIGNSIDEKWGTRKAAIALDKKHLVTSTVRRQ